MKRSFNLPFDYIHDVGVGFGRLLVPAGKGRWLMVTKRWKFRRTHPCHGFHNCTATGVY